MQPLASPLPSPPMSFAPSTPPRRDSTTHNLLHRPYQDVSSHPRTDIVHHMPTITPHNAIPSAAMQAPNNASTPLLRFPTSPTPPTSRHHTPDPHTYSAHMRHPVCSTPHTTIPAHATHLHRGTIARKASSAIVSSGITPSVAYDTPVRSSNACATLRAIHARASGVAMSARVTCTYRYPERSMFARRIPSSSSCPRWCAPSYSHTTPPSSSRSKRAPSPVHSVTGTLMPGSGRPRLISSRNSRASCGDFHVLPEHGDCSPRFADATRGPFPAVRAQLPQILHTCHKYLEIVDRHLCMQRVTHKDAVTEHDELVQRQEPREHEPCAYDAHAMHPWHHLNGVQWNVHMVEACAAQTRARVACACKHAQLFTADGVLVLRQRERQRHTLQSERSEAAEEQVAADSRPRVKADAEFVRLPLDELQAHGDEIGHAAFPQPLLIFICHIVRYIIILVLVHASTVEQ